MEEITDEVLEAVEKKLGELGYDLDIHTADEIRDILDNMLSQYSS